MILTSVHGDVVIPRKSFVKFMFDLLKQHEDRIALVDDRTLRCFTFSQVIFMSKAFANYLRLCAGLQKGDVVALLLNNCLEIVVIILAAAATGVVITTCNPNYTELEIHHQLKHACPRMIITSSEILQKVQKVASHSNTVATIITLTACSGKYKSFDECVSYGARQEYTHVEIDETNDPWLLPYSSGTTGLPKGVVLTQYCLKAALSINRNRWGYTKSDTLLTLLPAFHLYGIIGLLTTLVTGSKHVLGHRFSVDGFLKSVEKHSITRFHAVPPMITVLYNDLHTIKRYNVSSLLSIMCGAAPIADEVASKVCTQLNCKLFQVCGMTEFTAVAIGDVLTCPTASVGLVPPNTQLKVIDTNSGISQPANRTGEICAKGPQIMLGYYKNPQATAATIDMDGWLHTGDIGYYDQHQRIYIVDRIKDIIKRKGFQVSPAELEGILLIHPKVSDVAVVGIVDKFEEEHPKAFIRKKDDSLTSKDVHDYLQGKVSKFKFLTGGIEFVENIPKSPSGKILKTLLKQKAKL